MKTLVRELDPELVTLAARINVIGEGRRVPHFPRTSHIEAAAKLIAEPGTWQFVVVYPAAATAKSTASQIRNGLHGVYLPKGDWAAEALPVGVGTGLFVKYTGGAS